MSKIRQFRDVAHTITHSANYIGSDENGDPLYNPNAEKPKILFTGTVKLHGTNASVAYHNGKIQAQSKSRRISIGDDNFGFAFFVEQNKNHFESIMESLAIQNSIDTTKNIITVYGEWAGEGIQKGIGISNIEKSFFIFGWKVTDIDAVIDDEGEMVSEWMPYESIIRYSVPEDRIYNLYNFKLFHILVDFNSIVSVGEAQSYFEKVTYEVEDECPVSVQLGDVISKNIAYEENGKIWFEKESGFIDKLKVELEPYFKEIREELPNGVNYIKFNLD